MRRLGRRAARRAARRLGVPVQQPALPGRGRHRRRRHAAAPQRRSGPRRRDRARARLDHRHAERGTAAGARSTPTTRTITSTTSPSPTTARCSTRRPPTSPRAASRSSRSSAARRTDRRSRRAIAYLRREQEADGSWFGRWGTNYIYGTWSVLCALNAAGVSARRSVRAPRRGMARFGPARGRRLGRGRGELRRRAARTIQGEHAVADRLGAARPDGGGRGGHPAVARGARIPRRAPRATTASGDELPYTAVGFPRVFYLRYHGYRLFFPLLAMARYRNLRRGNSRKVAFGF